MCCDLSSHWYVPTRFIVDNSQFDRAVSITEHHYYAIGEPFLRDGTTPVRYSLGNLGRAVFWTLLGNSPQSGCYKIQMYVVDMVSNATTNNVLDSYFGKIMDANYNTDGKIRMYYVITREA